MLLHATVETHRPTQQSSRGTARGYAASVCARSTGKTEKMNRYVELLCGARTRKVRMKQAMLPMADELD